METNIIGLWKFKSPYHKNKWLPFLVKSNNEVETVEYRGKTAYKTKSKYENIQETLEKIKAIKVCEMEILDDSMVFINNPNIFKIMNIFFKANVKDFI